MNALELRVGRQAGECAGEMRVPGTGEDVLKAVGLEQRLLDHAGLELGQPASAGSDKVIAVGSGLRLHNPVDCPDQLDQLVDRRYRAPQALVPASRRRHSSSSMIACWHSSFQWKKKTSL